MSLFADPQGQGPDSRPTTQPATQPQPQKSIYETLQESGRADPRPPIIDEDLLSQYSGWENRGGPSEGLSFGEKALTTIGQMTEGAAGEILSTTHNFAANVVNLFGGKMQGVSGSEALARSATYWKTLITHPVRLMGAIEGKSADEKFLSEELDKQRSSSADLRNIVEDWGDVPSAMVRGSEMFGSLLGTVAGPEGMIASKIGHRVSQAMATRMSGKMLDTVEKAGLSLARAEDAIGAQELLSTSMEQIGKRVLGLSPQLSARLTEKAFKWMPELTGQAVGWGAAGYLGGEGGALSLERAKHAAVSAALALPMVVTGRIGNWVEKSLLGKLGAPAADDLAAFQKWLNGHGSRATFARMAAGAVEGLAFPLLATDFNAYEPIIHAVMAQDGKALGKALIEFGLAGPAGMALMRGVAPSQLPFYRARNREIEHANFEKALATLSGWEGRIAKRDKVEADVAEFKQKQGEDVAAEGEQVAAERQVEATDRAKQDVLAAKDAADTNKLIAEDQQKSLELRGAESAKMGEANIGAAAAGRSTVPPEALTLVDSGWELTGKVSRRADSTEFELSLPGEKRKINLTLSQDGTQLGLTIPHDLFAEAFPKSIFLENKGDREPLKFHGEGAGEMMKAMALRSNTDAAVMRMLAEKMGLEPHIAGIFQREDGSLVTLRFGKLYESVDGGTKWFESEGKADLPKKSKPAKALGDASDTLKRVVRAIEMTGDFADGDQAPLVKRALESLRAAADMIRNGSAKDPFVHETAALVSDPMFAQALAKMSDAGDMLDVAHEVMATAAGFSSADKSLARVTMLEQSGNERRMRQAEKRAESERKSSEEAAQKIEAEAKDESGKEPDKAPDKSDKAPDKPAPSEEDGAQNRKQAIEAVSKYEEESTWARKRKREKTLEASEAAYEMAKKAAAGEGVPSSFRVLLEKPWSLRRGQPNPDIPAMERLDALKRFAASEKVEAGQNKIELTNERVANLLGLDRGTVAKYRKAAGEAYTEAVGQLRKEAAQAEARGESPAAWFEKLPAEQKSVAAKAMTRAEDGVDKAMLAEGGPKIQELWRGFMAELKKEWKNLGMAAPAFAFLGDPTSAGALGLGGVAMSAMAYAVYRGSKNHELLKKAWGLAKWAIENTGSLLRKIRTVGVEYPLKGLSKMLLSMDNLLHVSSVTKPISGAVKFLWNKIWDKIRDVRNELWTKVEKEGKKLAGEEFLLAHFIGFIDVFRKSPKSLLEHTRAQQAGKSKGEIASAIMSTKLVDVLGEDPHAEGSLSYHLVRAIQGKEEPSDKIKDVFEEAKTIFADFARKNIELGLLSPERIIKNYYPQAGGGEGSAREVMRVLRENKDVLARIGFDSYQDGSLEGEAKSDPFGQNVMSQTTQHVVRGGVKTGFANIGPFMPRSKGVLDPAEFKSDPRVVIPANMVKQSTVQALRKMFNDIAVDPALSVSTREEAERLWGKGPGAFYEVGKAETGKVPEIILGPAIGKFVHPAVHTLIKRTRYWQSDFMEGVAVVLSAIKRAAITANPQSALRQELSQSFVMSVIGVHGQWTDANKKWALAEITNNGPLFKELMEAGQIGTEFAVEQILNNRSTREDIYKWAKNQDRGRLFKMISGVDALFRSEALGMAANAIENAYSKSDVLAKLISYKFLKDKVGQQEAIERVASLYNYKEMTPIMESIGTLFWYQRFNYKIAEATLKYGIHTPLSSIGIPILFMAGIRAFLAHYFGETEDDRKTSMEMAGKGLASPAMEQGIFPIGRDANGRMNYHDLSTMNPFEGPLKWIGMVKSPYASQSATNPAIDMGRAVLGAFAGKDPGLPGGKVFEESDGPLARIGYAAAYAVQQAVPKVSGVPLALEAVRATGTGDRDATRRANRMIEGMALPGPVVDSEDMAGVYASQAKEKATKLADLKSERVDMLRDMRDKLADAKPAERTAIFRETNLAMQKQGFAPLDQSEAKSAMRFAQVSSPIARSVFSSGGAVQFAELDDLLSRGRVAKADAREIMQVLKGSPEAMKQAIYDYALLNGVTQQEAAKKIREIVAKLRELGS